MGPTWHKNWGGDEQEAAGGITGEGSTADRQMRGVYDDAYLWGCHEEMYHLCTNLNINV